jgi:broad specificity phosphatase PhoE
MGLMGRVHFITHPEVEILPSVPVTEWTLSGTGLSRAGQMLSQPWCQHIASVFCSTERKALIVAEMLSEHLGVPCIRHAGLGENDRSATGYLAKEDFERTADQFFANPDRNVCGWETARDAQLRIVAAVDEILRGGPPPSIAIVAHGGVGALLRCHLKRIPISRKEDQPRQGSYFTFTSSHPVAITEWRAIDSVAEFDQSAAAGQSQSGPIVQ